MRPYTGEISCPLSSEKKSKDLPSQPTKRPPYKKNWPPYKKKLENPPGKRILPGKNPEFSLLNEDISLLSGRYLKTPPGITTLTKQNVLCGCRIGSRVLEEKNSLSADIPDLRGDLTKPNLGHRHNLDRAAGCHRLFHRDLRVQPKI